jgi:hypothetical protein
MIHAVRQGPGGPVGWGESPFLSFLAVRRRANFVRHACLFFCFETITPGLINRQKSERHVYLPFCVYFEEDWTFQFCWIMKAVQKERPNAL